MYQIKETAKELIKEKIRISYLTKKTELSRQYISMIINKNQVCSQVVAYNITKALDENKKIEDYFIKIS
jgi:plasmid maintenance system antidote protein VapI